MSRGGTEGGTEAAAATDFAAAFPMEADAVTPRLALAETIPMDTSPGPAQRTFESLCFVAAPAPRKPLPGFPF